MARLMGGTHERRAAGMIERGIDRPVAGRLASGQGEEMGRAILATEDDLVGSDDTRRRAAERAGARTELLCRGTEPAATHWDGEASRG